MSETQYTNLEEAIIESTITNLVLANRILAKEEVIDDFGHVSARHPLNSNHYFISRSRSPEIVTRADIMEFNLEGELVGEDPRRPYRERHIHGAIYKDRPDVHAVTHHHARSIIPFTMNPMSLRPVFHMATVIGKQVDTWDSQDEFGDTNMLVDSMEMGHSLSRTLGENRVALLRGHGCVCAAESIRAVCMVSIGLKDNAQLIQDIMKVGELSYLTDGEIDKTSAMLLSPMPLERAWSYWVSRAGFGGL